MITAANAEEAARTTELVTAGADEVRPPSRRRVTHPARADQATTFDNQPMQTWPPVQAPMPALKARAPRRCRFVSSSCSARSTHPPGADWGGR
ncbi:hypothetical protein [Mycobacterium persicum]|uniref:hypothetical protein n=1 Tax=Mycobacterium persicum TaxID=1487726 RepID=UPI000A0C5A91|nr:hypothetical protein BST40_14920 [Mycobacterium persicum]ORB97150.1 hypothetical protein B1T44_24590 [Mycobacterium persicum]ORC03821.1 hypothetical protein B1T48_23870 [Mycobacterium persicum]